MVQNRRFTEGEESIPPHEWLNLKIKEFEALRKDKLCLPLRGDGKEFSIEDLYPDQKYIAYEIMKTLKQFMTSDDLTNFEPMRCTIIGKGGSGKTVLLNTLSTVVRKMFLMNDVARIAAPTGVAAFNVGGETLHRMNCRGYARGEYKANSLTSSQFDTLVKKFRDLLLFIVDERSMMNSLLLGTSNQIMSETIYNGAMATIPESFGGLPVTVLCGDDMQLSGMGEGAFDALKSTKHGKMTQKGRATFLECANTVFEMTSSRRLADNKQFDREILDAVRLGENVKEEHVDKLMSLQLKVIQEKHGPDVVAEIRKQSIYLYWTNAKRIDHNMKELVTLNSEDNPTAIMKAHCTGSKCSKGVNFHFKNRDVPMTCMVCREAKCAIHGCNFMPEWALFNGACGEVDEIVFDDGQNPNDGCLASYIVLDFPLYCGPVWDVDNPTVCVTGHEASWALHGSSIQKMSPYLFSLLYSLHFKHVPIPPVTVPCEYHCCERTFFPLDIAFARTVHRFQGLSAGPVDPGKIPNVYESIICDPDVKLAEGKATGLLYTALSRATTLGDDDGLNSAIYFEGSDIDRDRFQNLTLTTTTQQELKNVTKRSEWVQHLKQHTKTFDGVKPDDFDDVLNWTKTTYTYDELFARIQKYCVEKNNGKRPLTSPSTHSSKKRKQHR